MRNNNRKLNCPTALRITQLTFQLRDSLPRLTNTQTSSPILLCACQSQQVLLISRATQVERSKAHNLQTFNLFNLDAVCKRLCAPLRNVQFESNLQLTFSRTLIECNIITLPNVLNTYLLNNAIIAPRLTFCCAVISTRA